MCMWRDIDDEWSPGGDERYWGQFKLKRQMHVWVCVFRGSEGGSDVEADFSHCLNKV